MSILQIESSAQILVPGSLRPSFSSLFLVSLLPFVAMRSIAHSSLSYIHIRIRIRIMPINHVRINHEFIKEEKETRDHPLNHILRSSRTRTMTTVTAMAATTTVAASPHMCLLDDDVASVVHEQRPEGGPREEDHLHDAECERGLQHRAMFVGVPRERIIGAHTP